MLQPLLISLRMGDTSWSFAVEGTAQSMVWIGFADTVDADEAIAVATSTETQVILSPRRGHHLLNVQGEELSHVPLSMTEDMLIYVMGPDIDGRASLHVRPVTEGMKRFEKLVFMKDAQFTIGRNAKCNIVYNNPFVSGEHVQMVYQAASGSFYVKDMESGNGTLLNGRYLPGLQPYELKVGDILQVLDLVMVAGKGFITHSCPEQLEIRNLPEARTISHETLSKQFDSGTHSAGDMSLFYPAPRLSRTVNKYELQVDDPPAKKEQEEQSALMQMGPSLFMGISSVFTAANSFTTALSGDGGIMKAIPSALTALSMVGGSLIWPNISRKYKQKSDARKEEQRQRRYTDYLDGVENDLLAEANLQGTILRENRLPLSEIEERAHNLSPFMMNRMATHDDFMELRVGMGDMPIDADVKWPSHRFSLTEDPLLNKVEDLSANPPQLTDVPMAFNPVEHPVTGVVGDRATAWAFTRGLLMQICSYYSYQDVKIILVSSEEERDEWSFLVSLPHFYDDLGERRLVALSLDGIVAQNQLLAATLEERTKQGSSKDEVFTPHYIVVCANKELAERSDAIHAIAGSQDPVGISLIYLSETLHGLPRDVSYIIDLARESERYFAPQSERRQTTRKACMFEQNNVTGTMVDFDPDIMAAIPEAKSFGLDMARIRLDVASERSMMPTSLGFLEMFHVGNVTHLNIAQRWAENDGSRSLATPLGYDEMHEYAMLNLHENIHGPHGLIAGTTGSGKSEFIITYILSMCVNYAPDEAAFVLIDYKGGGLAGAFENERYHLPHLAGTITNLDGGAIQRSLVSIQSELKRRQDMFNKARDITGESTVDIYKYISYYRQGVLTEPLPHLFVIADEFAELKQQEPEFMDELVSAARIGRSLGVHLILATQRPTGVVNDQIQANSKFKICLKVADAGDSKEMIRRPDAAEIKRPGQFYMLVGYNESFGGGQAAYAGSKYVEKEKFEAKTDNAVDLLDSEGALITTMRPTVAAKKSDKSELNAVLEQLIKTADSLDKHAHRLWLDPLPERETFDYMAKKYGPVPTDGLTFALGEVDDPMRQRQFRYNVNLVDTGNILFYGMQTSGVGETVSAIMYDLATRYSPTDFWFYGVDLGAGSLALLRELPHCGGVCVAGEDERLENLFKLLEREVEERKQVVAQYRSIAAYNKQAREKGQAPLPRIVLAVDNLASFRERYDSLYDRLTSLSMDGPMCGVYLMLTAANNNAASMKLKQNCAFNVVGAMSDPTDVSYILVNARQAPTPNNTGRALINIEKEAFAIQCGSIADDPETEPAVVASVAERMKAMTNVRARRIPVLPVHVTADDMGPLPAHTVPVGFSKTGVEPYFFNTTKYAYMLVVGEDTDVLASYFKGMRETFRANKAEYRFIDDGGIMGITDDPWVLTTTDQAEEFVRSLPPKPLQAEYYVFTNMTKTMSGLSKTGQSWLTDLLTNERTKHKVVMVTGIEAMRTKGNVEDWYMFMKQAGGGLWIGTGFGNQMVLPYGRTLPEYNQPAAYNDGFVSSKGQAMSIRVVEPAQQDKTASAM